MRKRRNDPGYDWGSTILRVSRERDLPHMKGPVCRCNCHRNGDEDHRECCFFTAARERDEAQEKAQLNLRGPIL